MWKCRPPKWRPFCPWGWARAGLASAQWSQHRYNPLYPYIPSSHFPIMCVTSCHCSHFLIPTHVLCSRGKYHIFRTSERTTGVPHCLFRQNIDVWKLHENVILQRIIIPLPLCCVWSCRKCLTGCTESCHFITDVAGATTDISSK